MDRERTAARHGHFHQRDGLRLADRSTFAQPVTILPNTTYVAAYLAPNGHESGDDNYFYPAPRPRQAGGADSTSAAAVGASRNDRERQRRCTPTAPTSTFPTSTFSAANYWVDPVFMPVAGAGQVTNVTGDRRASARRP